MPFVVPNGKKIPNGNPYVFVDFQEEQQKTEIKPIVAEKPKAKSKGKKSEEEVIALRKLSSQSNTACTKTIGMLNIGEFNNSLVNQILAEELKMDVSELKNNETRNQCM